MGIVIFITKGTDQIELWQSSYGTFNRFCLQLNELVPNHINWPCAGSWEYPQTISDALQVLKLVHSDSQFYKDWEAYLPPLISGLQKALDNGYNVVFS